MKSTNSTSASAKRLLLPLLYCTVPAALLAAECQTPDSNLTEARQTDTLIQVATVRSSRGEAETALHTNGQLRMGYITYKAQDASRKSAYAIGGHMHFDTQRWHGWKIGASAYTVLNLGINQNPNHLNPDFFDAKGRSFILLSKAFLDGKWGHTELKLGRQTLDTPMADSDDIRMIPNFFQAYTLTNRDIENLTLTAGYIEKMAGWENGVDASAFVNIGEVLGTEKTDGVYYGGAVFNGFDGLSLSLWYYHYEDIANIVYAEAGYVLQAPRNIEMTLGLQFGGTHETGAKRLGVKDGEAYGISLETCFTKTGLTLITAFNSGNGKSGATDLSLGGGPFFTSMEDQTIDAIGGEGTAWMAALAYDFEKLHLPALSGQLAYGSFMSTRSIGHYHTSEADVILEYHRTNLFKVTAAAAYVNHKDGQEDYTQCRLIGSYNF